VNKWNVLPKILEMIHGLDKPNNVSVSQQLVISQIIVPLKVVSVNALKVQFFLQGNSKKAPKK
jgi:hypothetical protein